MFWAYLGLQFSVYVQVWKRETFHWTHCLILRFVSSFGSIVNRKLEIFTKQKNPMKRKLFPECKTWCIRSEHTKIFCVFFMFKFFWPNDQKSSFKLCNWFFNLTLCVWVGRRVKKKLPQSFKIFLRENWNMIKKLIKMVPWSFIWVQYGTFSRDADVLLTQPLLW